jgi:L-fuculose-phosphate aldolase
MNPKLEIIEFFKRLYQRNLTTSSGGNVSILSEGLLYISPTEKDKALLEEDDVSVIDFDSGKQLSGLKPTSEILMHQKIFETRKDIKTIIHAHPFYSTIFSVVDEPLKINLVSEAAIFLKKINYVDYTIPGSEKLANLVAKAIVDSDVLILKNHGVLAVGKNCIDCFHKIEVLEFNAKLQYSISGRKDINFLKDEDLEEIKNKY